MNFTRIKAFYRVFTAGQMVANPVAWKTGQVTASVIASLLSAALVLAKAAGYALPISDDQIVQIAGVVITVYGVFNGGVTAATTTKIGLPAIEPGPSKPVVPAVAEKPAAYVPPVRRAANGEIMGDTQREP